MPLHFIVSVLPVTIFLGWYNLFMFSLDFFIFSFEYQILTNAFIIIFIFSFLKPGTLNMLYKFFPIFSSSFIESLFFASSSLAVA